MAKRFLSLGENRVNGYIINVVRFVPSQQRPYKDAVYYGEVITPEEEVLDFTEGKTAGAIKKMIGLADKKPSVLEQALVSIKKTREELFALGISTAEIDELIERKEQEIEAEKNRVDNSAEIKRLRKEIKKLESLKESLEDVGLDTLQVTDKINGFLSRIEELES